MEEILITVGMLSCLGFGFYVGYTFAKSMFQYDANERQSFVEVRTYKERLLEMNVVDLKLEYKRLDGLYKLGINKRVGLTDPIRDDLSRRMQFIKDLLAGVPVQ